MKSQYDLQQEILSATGLNLVTCGNCGTTIIHHTKQTAIVCSDCGFMSEPCDFPDLNVSGTTREMQHPLYQMAVGLPRLLDEVFLNDDENEENPLNIYVNATNYGMFFLGVSNDKNVRIWKLTDTQINISNKYREDILKMRLGKYTEHDEVNLSDIFMYGKFNKELTDDEYLKELSKTF